eukprot:g41129.t1
MVSNINPEENNGSRQIPGCALRSCVDQLVDVFAKILNRSLLQSEDPTCFKKTTITLIPKKTCATCLNNYCLIALTSKIKKCIEMLVMVHIDSSLPVFLNLQFAYRQNRSTADTSSLALHASLKHLDNKHLNIRLLQLCLLTIIPTRLISELQELERKEEDTPAPHHIYINGAEVERVENVKILGQGEIWNELPRRVAE